MENRCLGVWVSGCLGVGDLGKNSPWSTNKSMVEQTTSLVSKAPAPVGKDPESLEVFAWKKKKKSFSVLQKIENKNKQKSQTISIVSKSRQWWE